ncbi:MAG: hypothetical protein IK113_09105 [Bacteroidales bacterium]|nr:hypothetical protein [Bacteroidales bacterium]
MKRLLKFALILIGAVSCSRAIPVTFQDEAKEQALPPARITETIRYDDSNCTAYNFEYPSSDPFGKPVTLSGTIVIGDEITTEKPARGLFLYNHLTIYVNGECPSSGELTVQKIMVGSGLISISADYYGFGVTAGKHQAYGLADTNGQASIDALIAARTLLADMGYSWDDVIFNLGYSQGGQVAVAALKIATEKHPEIHFTRTFAGGGLYDVSATYRFLVSSGAASLPDTVISVLLAYNEFYKLGIPLEKMFREPLLGHIDQWFLSKDYNALELRELLGTTNLGDLVTPDLLDIDSDISKKFFQAMDRERLCRGWAPWLNEKISLVHNKADDVVPVVNTENLLRFLENHGLTVDARVENFRQIPGVLAPHFWGAAPFFTDSVSKISSALGIGLWIDLSSVLQLLRDYLPED